ncbi:MAG TPA: hypothetical protein VFA04_20105 [Bryobacteraceae bacterium]|nr:hypothetical protein [Bryobacteraceae bacterium]
MDIDERIQALTVNIESLHDSIHELYETVQRNDQRLRAVEDMSLRLANIVIRHEERLDSLDGGE